MAEPTSNSPRFPGWYPDESDLTLERFWDGLTWTSNTRVPGLPESLLGPIDPTLAALLFSFEGEHPPLAQRMGHPSAHNRTI